MLNIAVVEDHKEEREHLTGILQRYSAEFGESFHISEFPDAVEFLHQYKANYQIVFMDIHMPHINGLDAARKFRKLDSLAVLVFITSMAQYAIKGYEFNALDYIIKPVNYYDFALKMKRAVRQAQALIEQPYLIHTKNGIIKLSHREIRYVEVSGHRITYHTDGGEIQTHGSMKEVIQKLDHPAFALCNNCYYVNMHYVTAVENFTVKLGKTELQISHPKKKEFLKALNAYVGGSSI